MGRVANPNGRPKGSVSIKAELEKIIDLTVKNEHKPFTDVVEDMPVGRKIALNMAIKAAEGDLWTCKDGVLECHRAASKEFSNRTRN